jgi:tripartite-type tricarboxylate transporter receptor subunit TctC
MLRAARLLAVPPQASALNTARRHPMIRRRTLVQAGLAAPALAGFGHLVQAQALEQPKFYFGFPAGSAGDILTRKVAERVGGTAYSRNAAVVENKPGAGGRIALDTLKAAPPDGSQLTMTPFACTAIYPHVYTTAWPSARWCRPA